MKSSEERKEVKIPLIVLQVFLIISISVFTSVGFGLLEAPRVEAQTFEPTACCTSGPSACTDLPAGECENICGGDCEASICNSISTCTLGCGIDSNEGICAGNTPKGVCEDNEDCEWYADPFCNINECEEVCCVLGNNAQFVTRDRCQILSEREGLPIEIRPEIDTAVGCYDVVHELDEGACVFQDDFCKFTTQAECNTNIGGEFHKDLLCTNSNLDTRCEVQDQASCIEGRDGVYFVDTCGNRANIYDSSKTNNQAYWNTVKYPDQSCGSNSANLNGECGNCDYTLGSICGEFRPGTDNGNMDGLTCRDLNCIDDQGDKRTNGESWCVYDGLLNERELPDHEEYFETPLGFDRVRSWTVFVEGGEISADTVGSRHVREVCSNGIVQQEACADYRQEICVENEKELSNGKKIDDAICRVNLANDCVLANLEGSNQGSCDANTECGELCADNPDCRIQDVDVASKFKFKTCVPIHPVGRDFRDAGEGLVTAEDSCGFASRTCIVAYKKKLSGGWKCQTNCDCQNIDFTTQMNNLCVSVGDCGAYTNYVGNVTFEGYSRNKKGGKAKTPPRLNESEWEPLFSAMAEDGRNTEDGGFFKDEFDLSDLNDHGVGDPFLVGYMSDDSDYDPAEEGFLGVGNPALIAGAVTYFAFAIYGAITAASAVGAGAGLASQLVLTSVCMPCLAIAIVIIILVSLLGIGKIKTSEINFVCKPWQQPYGGNDCTVCGEDGKPCTRYRCESLGTRCELINENTGVDECIAFEGEEGIPVITPWEDVLNKTAFSYQDVSTNGFRVRTSGNDCIQAFTPLVLGVNTDVLAQCKWDVEDLSFEEMNFDFSREGIFKRNHSLTTALPSVDSLIAAEANPGETVNQSTYQYLLNQVGDLNLHVKCVNLDGISNDVDYRINFCVDPGPDLTPPVVTDTFPADGSTVRFDSVEESVQIYISEPAECKWSNTAPSGTDLLGNFNALENTFECTSDAEGVTAFGYPCTGNLPITGDENKYHIICRDQPWLAENISRNIGNTFEYNLLKTQTQLNIDLILPSGTIYAGTEPITVELEATTSEGANGGRASCDYSLNGNNFITFFQTDARTHKQLLNQMTAGDYDLRVRCEDYVGNIVEKSESFTLELDTQAPIVTRVFSSGGTLRVKTNEDANCYYRNDSTSSCSFTLNDATAMNSQTTDHSTSWSEDNTYYIKCEDIWGNIPNACNIVVKPYSL